jgi:uncharacterized protein
MPTTASHSDRVLQVADLVGRPGSSRRLELEFAAPDGLDNELVRIAGPVELSGVIESVVDGLLVRGGLHTRVAADCSRCLEPIEQDVDTDVVELFRDPADVDPDDELEAGYEIVDDRIDLDDLLRDALAPALPYSPVCTPDCKGLCATCGTDRNKGSCDCTETHNDDRWAALEALRLPPDDGAREDVERGGGGR